MKSLSFPRALRPVVALALTLMVIVPAAADEPAATNPDPGFRPASDQSAAFLEAVGNTSFDVLPTMIHRIERTAHSFDSQELIVAFINGKGMGRAQAKPFRIDQGILERRSQSDLFQRGIQAVASEMLTWEPEADYTLVMEILVPGDQAVFGIHVYILDRQGRNAFSFLLNSHHKLFVEAGLVASSTSEDARANMIADATRTGMRALQAQIRDALECTQRRSAALSARAGVLHDFEKTPRSGTDEFGVPVGYSIFAGPETRVNFRTTHSYPPRAGAVTGNGVLQIDFEVDSWGGVINRFANESLDEWVPQDWRQLMGFSFWFHGENSGAPVFFDVFDNRADCSRTDDAERFRYRFMDDVAGWREVKVRFADLQRWNVGNNAPDDGFGLDEIHGWGIGTSNSEGPVDTVFYIDDVRLLGELPDPFVESAQVLAHGPIKEIRIDESTSRIETSTRDEGSLVVTRVIDLMCACVRLALERNYSYYRIDEREMLNGNRARFRLTLYRALPGDVPIAHIPQPSSDALIVANKSAAIPADRMRTICSQKR